MIDRSLTYCFNCYNFIRPEYKLHDLHTKITYHEKIEEDKYQHLVKLTIDNWYKGTVNIRSGECSICFYGGWILRISGLNICPDCLQALARIVKE